MVSANHISLNPYNAFHCEGIYAPNAIPFAFQNSSITLEINGDVTGAVVIYNFADEQVFDSESNGDFQLCGGAFCFKNATSARFPILNAQISETNKKFSYIVTESGYYWFTHC